MLPTIESFWRGPDAEDRRKTYAREYAPRSTELEAAAAEVHRRICAVAIAYEAERGPTLPGRYSSGWRPRTVNEQTANAGPGSAHLEASAGDVATEPDGDFAWWALRNPHILAVHALYMEHPAGTVLRAYAQAQARARLGVAREAQALRGEGAAAPLPTPWCHITTRAPASHTRAYFPDPKAVAEWDAYLAAGGDPGGCTFAAWAALFPPAVGGPGAAPGGREVPTPTPRGRAR